MGKICVIDWISPKIFILGLGGFLEQLVPKFMNKHELKQY